MKPILFNTEMVQAILEGRKLMTRRPVKLPKSVTEVNPGQFHFSTGKDGYGDSGLIGPDDLITYLHLEPYKVDDVLYVRETWQLLPSGFNEIPPEMNYIYRASHQLSKECTGWRPSIHMPKEAARIFLKVKNARIERIQDITNADIRAEGFAVFGCTSHRVNAKVAWNSIYESPRECKKNGIITHYESYPWEDIQETREYRGLPWYVHGNPWVWVTEFEKVKEGGNCEKFWQYFGFNNNQRG